MTHQHPKRGKTKADTYLSYIHDMVEPNTFYTARTLLDMLVDYNPPSWVRKYGPNRVFRHPQMPCLQQLIKFLRRDPLILGRAGPTTKHQKEWCVLLIGPVQQGETHPGHEVKQ
jgi:hypothetical protein